MNFVEETASYLPIASKFPTESLEYVLSGIEDQESGSSGSC